MRQNLRLVLWPFRSRSKQCGHCISLKSTFFCLSNFLNIFADLYFPVFSAGQSIPLTLRELQSCSTKSSPCYVEQCTCAVCLSAKISTSNFQLAQCRLQLSIRPIWMVHLECAKTQNFPKPDPNLKIGVFWVSGRITLIPI